MKRLLESVFLAAAMINLVGCKERPLTAGNTNDVVNIIKGAQKKHVRVSSGEWAYQCFTAADYQTFVRDQRAQKIAEQAKGNRRFVQGVLALKAEPEAMRVQFIKDCRRSLRPTWSQLGRVSREGQTETGQRAELDIANAIADTVAELCRLSDAEIFTVFKKY